MQSPECQDGTQDSDAFRFLGNQVQVANERSQFVWQPERRNHNRQPLASGVFLFGFYKSEDCFVCDLTSLAEYRWQLGDVACYASSFIESQPLSGLNIAPASRPGILAIASY